ncbi:MAG: zinc ribbon domain-containing protein [Nostocoides sp.]
MHSEIADAVLTLPRHRVQRGRSRVAATEFDEDVITLGAEAVRTLLDRTAAEPAALLLATVSAPLTEGGAAQTIAEMAGLGGPDLHVQELGGTTAAGAAGLVTAGALVAAGVSPVVVVAADTRRDVDGAPFGDAAVAVLIDTEGDVGRIVSLGSAAETFPDRWRSAGEVAVNSGDDSMLGSGAGPEHQHALLPDTASTLITVNTPVIARAGLLGNAAFLAQLLLTADTEPAHVVVSAGGVTHALRFEPGPGLPGAAKAARDALDGGIDESAPAVGPVSGFDPYHSLPRAWRDRRQDLALTGARCSHCEQVFFPRPHACPQDGPDGLEPWPLQHTGTVLTCTRDHLFPLGSPITMCVVDVDGGGRFYGQSAGGIGVSIGDRVRLVPRLLHRGGGRPQYFWKVAPIADAAPSTKETPACR